MRTLLDALIRRFLVTGTLTVRYPDGRTSVHRGAPGPHIIFHVSDWRAIRRMVTDPALAFGEGYMDGTIVPVGTSLYDALDLLLTNLAAGGRQPVMAVHNFLSRALKHWTQFNPARRSRQNVAHHYDLDTRLYRLLLDPDMNYSCAYFEDGDETLAEAQRAKQRHIAAKLALRPGMRVLDIGCGWGGLGLHLAQEHGAIVTGITLSEEQLAVARARAAPLGDRVRFELMDYRALQGNWDRVVSVGMFEHVGLPHYAGYFAAIRRALTPDGIALVHAMGRSHGPAATNPWLAKYIFPGGYSPGLSEVLPAVEKSGLIMSDLEILRLHYAETLRRWRANGDAHRAEILALYDARFCRMFEFYLAGAELAFRRMGHVVWQMQLTRQIDAAPLTRGYMSESIPLIHSHPQAMALPGAVRMG